MNIITIFKQIKVRPATKGLLTFIPGMQSLFPEQGTGGTNTASYCYGVWLKHLTLLWANGMRTMPSTLAELGPGDSLGIGLAAMLSGVNNYYALDVVRHSNTDLNLKIFDELVSLFEARAGRPAKGWPDYDEFLDENLFPSQILTEEVLRVSLSSERLAAIRNALRDESLDSDAIKILYMVPWSDESVVKKGSVDVVISHSVLEHVDDLDETYRALRAWLKIGGFMTHQIDFTSHGISASWNGYRAYPEFLWNIIRGKKPYLINRQPYSVHVGLIQENQFKISCNMTRLATNGIDRTALASQWQGISDTDFGCSGAFIQAVKKG